MSLHLSSNPRWLMLPISNSGRKIGQVCAKYLKEITLELGGAAPLVVLADADLEFAA